jgi:uncharacterized coiled-coil DUF342 family protein
MKAHDPVHVDSKQVARDSLKFEGKEVVDGKFKDGSDLTDDQLRLLSQMNAIADLV